MAAAFRNPRIVIFQRFSAESVSIDVVLLRPPLFGNFCRFFRWKILLQDTVNTDTLFVRTVSIGAAAAACMHRQTVG